MLTYTTIQKLKLKAYVTQKKSLKEQNKDITMLRLC